MWRRLLVSGAFVLACGGRHERNEGTEPFECALGALSGTWLMHHVELGGDCGAVADRSVTFGLAGELRPEGCTVDVASISVDRCGLHEDFSCPLADEEHGEDWVVVLAHQAPARVSGVGSVHRPIESEAACASAYAVDVTPF